MIWVCSGQIPSPMQSVQRTSGRHARGVRHWLRCTDTAEVESCKEPSLVSTFNQRQFTASRSVIRIRSSRDSLRQRSNIQVYTPCLRKTVQNSFCQNIVNFLSIII